MFLAFRDREYVLNLIEGATGGRFHPNFDRIGGLKDDLPKGWIDETKQVMRKLRTFCDEIEDLLFGNEIFQSRTRGVGIIPADVAKSYGLSGANLRAVGRRLGPAPRPDRCRWRGTRSTSRSGPTPTATAGHAAGCVCRRPARRPRSSTSCSTRCPAGPVMAKVPRIIKVPEGEAWVSTENPLGEMGYYVVSKGDLGPFRVKIRSASFNNISIVAVGAEGRVRPRHHHDPRQPVLHPRGHRSMSAFLAVDIPYWGQSLLRVLGGIVAVLLPAGTIVYVFLFKMMSFMQSRLGPMEAGPYGSMQLFAEVGKWLQKEDIVPERADARDLQDGPDHRARVARSCSSPSCRSAPTRGSPTSRRACSTPWRSARSP